MDDFFKKARPAKEVLPPAFYKSLVEQRKRGQRGPQRTPTKAPVTLRLDRDVLDAYKATGRGYQTRMAEVLRKASGVSGSKNAGGVS
jgi:uncharacterized protein (DUF4415 family)